jgi:hypothetical protein
MRLVALFVSLLFATAAFGYERFVAPNRKFEAYTTAHFVDGTGMKLFLRPAGSRDTGVLLWQNSRWIDAKWSPDSRFLAVIDHNDGHIADVYVFGVRASDAAQPQITLYYHTPNPGTYDVQWDVAGWRLKSRSVVLTKEVRDQEKEARERTRGFAITRTRVVTHIGDAPLPLPGFRSDLTNRWSQPLAGVKSRFDFMKQFSVFATLAAASGGSAPSR